MRSFVRRVLADRRGAAAVEFGIIAPAFLLMLLGVFQVGIWVQSYNAMRDAAAQTARNVSVEYQTDNRLSNAQIEDFGLGIATTAPYLLDEESTVVEVDAGGPPPQTIAGTRKMTLTITYQMPSFLSFADIDGPEVTFSRAVFVASA